MLEIQLQISMNCSTKHCFVATIAKSSYWYCKDALCCQRDIMTFICLCHCILAGDVPFADQRCCASPESPHPKAAACSHPAARHRTEENPQPFGAAPVLSAETHWPCWAACARVSLLCLSLGKHTQHHRLKSAHQTPLINEGFLFKKRGFKHYLFKRFIKE